MNPGGTHALLSDAQQEVLMQHIQCSLHFEPLETYTLMPSPFNSAAWYAPASDTDVLQPPSIQSSMMHDKALLRQIDMYGLMQKLS